MNRARRGRGLAPKTLVFDYKDVNSLKRFVTEGGKIVPRRISRLSAKQQRALKREIMRARQLAFLPYPGQN